MDFRLKLQLDEAFGSVNRYYCSQAYGARIDDKDLLLTYYIKSGGAADFAARYDQAVGPKNRWYCSESHGRDIRDPEVLWKYFVKQSQAPAVATEPEPESEAVQPELTLVY